MKMDPIQQTEAARNVDCDVCGDAAADKTAPCGHSYCLGCLNQMIRTACEDGQTYPPHCCHHTLNLDNPEVIDILLPEVAKLVEQSKQYYATRDKLFCCNSSCRKYIAPDQIDKDTHIGFCKACWGGTCSLCRQQPHIGKCKKDFQKEAMKHYHMYKGWKTCEVCQRTLEKSDGCNHITCPCGEEFCYICGQHWRNCDDPQDADPDYEKKLAATLSPWFRFPQQPRCYGKDFRKNTCLPQTFFCAKCESRCGGSGEPSYRCQDCGRHVCRGCYFRCIVDGRYHNPDWNAVPAEERGIVEAGRSGEESSAPSSWARSGLEED